MTGRPDTHSHTVTSALFMVRFIRFIYIYCQHPYIHDNSQHRCSYASLKGCLLACWGHLRGKLTLKKRLSSIWPWNRLRSLCLKKIDVVFSDDSAGAPGATVRTVRTGEIGKLSSQYFRAYWNELVLPFKWSQETDSIALDEKVIQIVLFLPVILIPDIQIVSKIV